MPQVIALLFAGAGLYAGYRWISREVRNALAAADDAEEHLHGQAANLSGVPRDLGSLEWDEQAGVYRPSRHT